MTGTTREARSRGTTIRDVARLSGVSISTASKALNQQGRMTPETRARVQEVAKELGFRPNGLARSLLMQRSFTVGLLTNDTYGRFTLPVMSGITEALIHRGVSVFLCGIEDDPALGRIHLDAMLEKRVDGIIASGRRIDRRLPVDLSDVGVPVVYAFTESPPDAICFISDDASGSRAAVEHLIAQGCRRIAHVTGPSSFAVVHQRADAYRAALVAAGLATPGLPRVLMGAWTEAWGHQAVATLLGDGAPAPDGVFCGNDQIARGVVDGLRERGLRVPEDVAVVGFDNWEIVAAATRPPLTTVDMNLKELGRRAGLTLLDLVDGRPIEPGIRRLPCRLEVRQSSGP